MFPALPMELFGSCLMLEAEVREASHSQTHRLLSRSVARAGLLEHSGRITCSFSSGVPALLQGVRVR